MTSTQRTFVLINIAVVMLVTATMVTWRHYRPTTLTEAELWLRHPDEYTSLTDTDYQVLSAYLESQRDIRIGSANGSSVVAPITSRFLYPIPSADQKWMKDELKRLQDETIAAFHGCMSHTLVVAPRFSVTEPYQVASFEEIENNELLYRHFPQSNGVIQFSCVAYSRTRSQSLFWVERSMTSSAVGKFVLMEKNGRGDWVIAGQMIKWIS